MRMTQTRSAGSAWTILATCICLGCWGCGPRGEVNQAPATDSMFTIDIDQGRNGAVDATQRAARDERHAIPRTLSFEMAGFGHLDPDADTPEQRASAGQAAILDALCRAMIEARRSRGRPDSDFIARLGPRLTISHCSTDEGYDVEVNLICRGVETTFLVRNGILQHPPRNLKLIHRIFEETNGEFSILGTDWSPSTRTCVAKVGCYVPMGLGEALAGDVTAASDETAQGP